MLPCSGRSRVPRESTDSLTRILRREDPEGAGFAVERLFDCFACPEVPVVELEDLIPILHWPAGH